MGNIMINEVCNLQCPYCFANKYVNGDTSTDITYANFKKAVDWVNRGETAESWNPNIEPPRIGVIGGEPTVHPQFQDLLMYAVRVRVTPNQEILVFTNALCVDRHIDFLARHDIRLLVNLNSPEDVGEKQYEITVENLRKLRMKGVNFSVGVNFYKADLNMQFVYDVIDEFALKELRIGITSPNTKEKIKRGSIAYFKEIAGPITTFIENCAEKNCGVHFDCQKIPVCVLDRYMDRLRKADEKVPVGVFEHAGCTPVIDILPDLKVVRCFGISGKEVALDMNSFENEDDVFGFYATQIDGVAKLVVEEEACKRCYERSTGKCQSGCIAYKIDKVLKINTWEGNENARKV